MAMSGALGLSATRPGRISAGIGLRSGKAGSCTTAMSRSGRNAWPAIPVTGFPASGNVMWRSNRCWRISASGSSGLPTATVGSRSSRPASMRQSPGGATPAGTAASLTFQTKRPGQTRRKAAEEATRQYTPGR